MSELTFNDLPKAVTNLTNEVKELRELLVSKEQQIETEQPEQFLNVNQAAELLNLTVKTLYNKVAKRELPVMKRGKRLYFSQTELTEYLKGGKKKSFAEISAEADLYLSKNKKSAAL